MHATKADSDSEVAFDILILFNQKVFYKWKRPVEGHLINRKNFVKFNCLKLFK